MLMSVKLMNILELIILNTCNFMEIYEKQYMYTFKSSWLIAIFTESQGSKVSYLDPL